MLRCAPPQSVSSESPGVPQLTEDSLLFDGPRATYGRFRVLHQIGAGSVGPVFRGEDSETRQAVVVKVIRVGLTPERVAVVGPALRALKDRLAAHPALCPIIDTGVVDVEPYVVSPVVAGDSLDVALREYGPANMADAIPRLRAVADALDTAAALDIAHGSLHLRDIVVSVEATVLTGIGIAAVLERVGVRPPVRRPYCAPEVALGRGISPAGDQYSLAAIAHEWLSGRRVPGPDSILVPTSSPEGAEALAFVFARAMAAEPSDRYPSATAFVDALADVADAVTPRGRTSRRKAVALPPMLQFDADEAPALTFATPEPAPPAVPPTAAAAPAAADDAADLDAFVPTAAFEDETARVPEPELRASSSDEPLAMSWADDDIVRHDDEPTAPAAGPRDLGDDEEPVAPYVAASHEFAAADTLSLPYADAGDEPPVGDPVTADEPEDTPRAVPAWALWGGVLVAGVLLVVLGGRALLRWGTPGPAGAVATTAAPAPNAPPAATPSTPAAPATDARRQDTAPPSATPEPAAESPAEAPRAAASNNAPAAAPKTAPAPSSAAAKPAAAAPAPVRPAAATPAPPKAAPPKAAPAKPAAVAPVKPAARATAKPAPPARAVANPAEAQPGRLLVRSSPAGAEVFLNGERRGVAPVAIRALALGAYTVRVQRSGYAAVEQRIVLEAGRPARALEVTLVRAGTGAAATPAAAPPAATTGSLVVDSRPAGARVFVDGAEAGRTPLTLPSVAAGEHAVRIELPGYLNVSTTTRVEPGARARVAVTLTAERPR